MAHVFTLALGPVQDFIAAARRTRDFWFGSWLLSELARAAGREIARSPVNSLIFPAASRLEDEAATFTNKVLAIVGEEPAAIGKAVRKAVDDRLAKLRDDAFRRLDGEGAQGNFLASVAKAQIEDLIEIQWAAAEISDQLPYAKARERAEALLGGLKNSRFFGPVTWGDRVPKSSIDGQRESVLHEDLFDSEKGPGAEALFGRYRVDEAERLCGVGLLKRLGRRRSSRFDHHFLSTGHLAAWPLLERLTCLAKDAERGPELRAAWRDFIARAGSLGASLEGARVFTEDHGHPLLGAYDGMLLFENRLPDLFLQPDKEKCKESADQLAPLLRAFLAKAAATPTPYYAVLVADGDHMGKLLETLQEIEKHQELSAVLSQFAGEAAAIVEGAHQGELILAGGDDVLAFLPLHRAVDCAKQLAERFAELLAPFALSIPKPSLSVGIGICHFLEPLGHALAIARGAEREAKRQRNSLALVVDKRSGAPVSIRGHWGEIDRELKDFVELHREDLVPDRLAFDLRELVLLAKDGLAPELLGREARRILSRKEPRAGRDSDAGQGGAERLEETYQRLDQRLQRGADKIGEFADRLIVARLLADAERLANVPLEKKA